MYNIRPTLCTLTHIVQIITAVCLIWGARGGGCTEVYFLLNMKVQLLTSWVIPLKNVQYVYMCTLSGVLWANSSPTTGWGGRCVLPPKAFCVQTQEKRGGWNSKWCTLDYGTIVYILERIVVIAINGYAGQHSTVLISVNNIITVWNWIPSPPLISLSSSLSPTSSSPPPLELQRALSLKKTFPQQWQPLNIVSQHRKTTFTIYGIAHL